MELAWMDHMSAGNAMIDSEHKELIAMVNEAGLMIKNRDSFALSQQFDQIERYFRAHFADEEKIAQAAKFPFTENRLEDECVLKALNLILDVIAGKYGVWSQTELERYFELLSNGLIIHILKEDMLMRSALEVYPYDSQPALHGGLAKIQAGRRAVAR